MKEQSFKCLCGNQFTLTTVPDEHPVKCVNLGAKEMMLSGPLWSHRSPAFILTVISGENWS